MEIVKIEGKCTCGEIQFHLNRIPIITHCCHCRWCQRETGSAFVLNAMIEAIELFIDNGSPDMIITPTLSGGGQKIKRCPTCKVALWSNYSGAGDKIHFVRVGTLLEPDSFPPDIHIFTSSKQPWIILSENTPAFGEYYDREKYWSKESLLRREKALSG